MMEITIIVRARMMKASRMMAGVKVMAKAGCTRAIRKKISMKMPKNPTICQRTSGAAMNRRSLKKAKGSRSAR